MITPDKAPEAPDSDDTCVPATALEVDGVAPQPGDEFEFKGKARCNRVKNGNVYFDTLEVNGTPTMDNDAEADKMPEDMGPEDMMAAAAKADQEGAMG